MRDTFVITENNKSFDTYFQEMKRRNVPQSSKFPPNGLAVPSPLLVGNAKSPTLWSLGSKRSLLDKMSMALAAKVGSKRSLLEGLAAGSKRQLLDPRRNLLGAAK